MERQRSSSSNNGDNNGNAIIKPWALVLLFSVFIVVFLPSFLSSAPRSIRPSNLKSNWDTLNFILVLFAIVCGLLGRRGSTEDSNESPQALNTSSSSSSAFVPRLRSSSSYPDLRQDSMSNSMPWRDYDDIQLYWRRTEPETRTIPVDTFVLRPSSSQEDDMISESPSSDKNMNFEIKETEPHGHRLSRLQSLPVIKDDANSMSSRDLNHRTQLLSRRHNLPMFADDMNLMNSHGEENHKIQLKSSPPPPMQRLSRRQSLPVMTDDQNSMDQIHRKEVKSSPSPPERHRRRRSAEKIDAQSLNGNILHSLRHRRQRSVEDLRSLEAEDDQNLQTAVKSKHRRRRSVDDLMNLDINESIEIETMLPRRMATPPPPPPPPPPLKKNHKNIANAIASFYQKRKKGSSKNKRRYDEILESSVAGSRPPPPPPPPPPPSSMFSQLFSKKSGGKSQRVHSVANAAPPPPPPPPPRQSKNLNRMRERTMFPLPPMSPLRPPPPPPPMSPVSYASDLQMLFSDEEVVSRQSSKRFNNVNSGELKEEGEVPPAVFCPSPDVNNKADMFIARFRQGLKLEKINSIREKERRGEEGQQKQVEEEEFMMVGSLFDDDDDNIINN